MSVTNFVITLYVYRQEEAGRGPLSGDEHIISFLVFLHQTALQQEDVSGIPNSCSGGCQSWLQVRFMATYPTVSVLQLKVVGSNPSCSASGK